MTITLDAAKMHEKAINDAVSLLNKAMERASADGCVVEVEVETPASVATPSGYISLAPRVTAATKIRPGDIALSAKPGG